MKSDASAERERLETRAEPGLSLAVIRGGRAAEFLLTVTPLAGEAPSALVNRAAGVLRDTGGQILNMDVFCAPAARGDVAGRLRSLWPEAEWPVTWIGHEGRTPGAAGVFVRAMTGVGIERIRLRGRAVGCWFDLPGGRQAILGDLRDVETSRPRPDQARRLFEQALEALGQAGLDFSDVVRTWFYLDDILSWYPEFNRVRSCFYRELGVADGRLPASTGVGARSLSGAAITGSLLARRPSRGALRGVPSPLQGPASRYGSSFDRAVEHATPDLRRVWVSGTAAIDAEGGTVHAGDAPAQIEHTLRVVADLLRSRHMDWPDVVRAVVYARRATDIAAYRRCLARAGIPPFPTILTTNVICRPDLLFEIELDAVKALSRRRPPR